MLSIINVRYKYTIDILLLYRRKGSSNITLYLIFYKGMYMPYCTYI